MSQATCILQFMSRYNREMNLKLHQACLKLAPGVLEKASGAYFGSILGTLNHLLIGDVLWLKRLVSHPASAGIREAVNALPSPTRLDEQLAANLEEWWQARQAIDALLAQFTSQLTEDALGQAFAYQNVRGDHFAKPLWVCVMQIFNHQTHHRGQITTLLTQNGVDIGVTDIPPMVPNVVSD